MAALCPMMDDIVTVVERIPPPDPLAFENDVDVDNHGISSPRWLHQRRQGQNGWLIRKALQPRISCQGQGKGSKHERRLVYDAQHRLLRDCELELHTPAMNLARAAAREVSREYGNSKALKGSTTVPMQSSVVQQSSSGLRSNLHQIKPTVPLRHYVPRCNASLESIQGQQSGCLAYLDEGATKLQLACQNVSFYVTKPKVTERDQLQESTRPLRVKVTRASSSTSTSQSSRLSTRPTSSVQIHPPPTTPLSLQAHITPASVITPYPPSAPLPRWSFAEPTSAWGQLRKEEPPRACIPDPATRMTRMDFKRNIGGRYITPAS